ncbi:SPRY domain-containing protein [Ditylenchus destructor]|uniref:SPRY domain-containing protein n=1 Tax=Ditylenchus destructor TaxID=166010 RepID=A0AAD4MP03_9BILA|nr:SPRY domain-containing protein [Ditylenchus destructor]
MDDIPMVDDSPESTPQLRHHALISGQQQFSIQDFIVPIDFEKEFEGGETSHAIDSFSNLISANPEMHSDMQELDESVVQERLTKLYPFVDVKKNPLPRFWSTTDRFTSLHISTDLLRVRYRGKGATHKDAAAVRANRPIPKSCVVYYFETKIVNGGNSAFMGIGFSEKTVNLNRLPGWDPTSYGYHGDDGNFFSSSGKGVEYGPTFTTDDIVGCGVNFVTREIFFTKNGTHLGFAARNIQTNADLYPTVGMQTVGEMIDANFGQKPFLYDIEKDIQAARTHTISSINSIELPPQKAIWMNKAVAGWLAHEGYSNVLSVFNRTTGCLSSAGNVTSRTENNSTPTTSRTSLSVVLENQSTSMEQCSTMSGFGSQETPNSGRRTVVKLVQEAIEEEMDNRRCIMRLIQEGKTAEAVDKIEQLFPALLGANRQLDLLLKIQQFVEMVAAVSKDFSSTETMNGQSNSAASHTYWDAHGSTSPSRPSSSHTHSSRPKRSNVDNGMRNAVKRRSSDEDTESRQSPRRAHHAGGSRSSGTPNTVESQNGSSVNFAGAMNSHLETGEPMDINDGARATANGNASSANGNCAGQNSAILAGTPPTSTTIIEEEFEDFGEVTDGLPLEITNGSAPAGVVENGYTTEEMQRYEKYAPLLAFGATVAQFASRYCDSGLSLGLRRRMDDAFSLVVHENPKLSTNAYLLDQKQRNIVAKAVNTAILELINRESSSQMDEYFRKARGLRQSALVNTPAALFADIDALVFEEQPSRIIKEEPEDDDIDES